MNLTKYVQDFYRENYKISLKGYEEDTYSWREKTQSHKNINSPQIDL